MSVVSFNNHKVVQKLNEMLEGLQNVKDDQKIHEDAKKLAVLVRKDIKQVIATLGAKHD